MAFLPVDPDDSAHNDYTTIKFPNGSHKHHCDDSQREHTKPSFGNISTQKADSTKCVTLFATKYQCLK